MVFECFWEIQIIATSLPKPDRFLHGRIADPIAADFPRIRSWLERCHRIHAQRQKKTSSSVVLRVINVAHRTVVEAPTYCQFAALSYVWGGTQQYEARTSHVNTKSGVFSLPKRLSQTIEDAIVVTKALGLAYLWVDSLCSLMDSPQRQHELRHMDSVYASALITIVDASGANADSGLAGISRPRKYCQRLAAVDGIQMTVPFPDYTCILTDPSIKWNTRKWTLQEKALSLRMLLFTDYQVFKQCSISVWCEDDFLEATKSLQVQRTLRQPLKWTSKRNAKKTDGQKSGSFVTFQIYSKLIEDYTKREVKNLSDNVNAVSGMLNSISENQVSGIPKRFLNQGLLWQVPLGSRARMYSAQDAPFPSWSWARWKLPDGCKWDRTDCWAESPNRKPELPWPLVFNEQPNGTILHTAYGHEQLADLLRRARVVSPHLKTVETMLYLPCETKKFWIGQSELVTVHSAPDELHDWEPIFSGKCIGYIRMSVAVRRGYSRIVPRAHTSMFRYWISARGPRCIRQVQAEGCGNNILKFKYSCQTRREWSVEHVLLTQREGHFRERVALGAVIASAWPESEVWTRVSKDPRLLRKSDWLLFA